MSTMNEHYEAVLHDLETRRAKCQKELADIEQAIRGIRSLTASQAPLFAGTPQQDESTKYAGISVRWAILNLLAEDAMAPMTTGAIAEALQRGGISSNAKTFASNVSAILSDMSKQRLEVEQAEGGGYQITPHGREVFQGIKLTPQYRNRGDSSASVQ